MRINRVHIKLLKALLHQNTHEIDATFDEVVTILIGQNGCGKSALLRELNPLPSLKPNYETGGFKRLYITHQGCNYEIGSDFTTSKGQHFFIKVDPTGGESKNLNESGTAGTQQELCESILGFTPFVNKIARGNIDFCGLKRSERKDLLAATYPSDMSLALQYHKRVCSQIRIYENNLGMLKARQSSINESLMNEKQLADLKKYAQDLRDFSNELDQVIFELTKDSERYLKQHTGNHRIELQQIHTDCLNILKRIKNVNSNTSSRIATRDNHTVAGLDAEKRYAERMRAELTSANEQLQRNADDLKEELSKLQQQADASGMASLKEYMHQLHGIENRLKELHVDNNVPVVKDEDLVTLEKCAPIIASIAEDIASADGYVWTSPVFEQAVRNLRSMDQDIQGLDEQVTYQRRIKHKYETELAKEKEYTYPPSCNLTCTLKETRDVRFKQLLKDIELAEKDNRIHEEKLKWYQTQSDYLKKAIQCPRSHIEKIKTLEHILQVNWWGKFLLNEQSLINVLNKNPTILGNRARLLIDNSKHYSSRLELEKERTMLTYKINILKNAELPTQALLTKALVEKEAQLNKLSKEYKKNQQEMTMFAEDCMYAEYTIDSINQLNALDAQFTQYANNATVDMMINFNQSVIKDCHTFKDYAQTELRELEITIKEQDGYLVRLNDEINPNIANIEKKLHKWKIVEFGLSPITGFPHACMVKFINGLLVEVNRVISVVWNYDMQLKYLSEDKPFGYTFKVNLYNNSSLKDIDICSKSQKVIINLAFNLALYKQLQLGDIAPFQMDEPDDGFTPLHRDKLLELVALLIDQKSIRQLFLVNHHTALFDAFADSDVVCINSDGIVTPNVYNQNVKIS